MVKQTQKQKIEELFKTLLPMEFLFNVPSEGNPYSFEEQGFTCRVHIGRNYGEFGGGFLVYLCNLRSYKQGRCNWKTFLVDWDRKVVKEIVVKNVLFLD